MEWEGSCMVPLIKVWKLEGLIHLTTMQIVKGLKKEEMTFLATITCLGEDDGAKETLPLCIKKVLEEN